MSQQVIRQEKNGTQSPVNYDRSIINVQAHSPNSSLLMIGSGEPGAQFAPNKDQSSLGPQVLISEPGQIMSDKKCQSVPQAFQTIQGPSTGKHSSKTSQMLSGDKSLDAHYMDPEEAYVQYKLEQRQQDQANQGTVVQRQVSQGRSYSSEYEDRIRRSNSSAGSDSRRMKSARGGTQPALGNK